ncbi:MAG: hypothetical protein M3O68_06975 [Thermoproteota archaeon]|nr:hypothetical protein [Thermoproteota archaeon]
MSNVSILIRNPNGHSKIKENNYNNTVNYKVVLSDYDTFSHAGMDGQYTDMDMFQAFQILP